MISKKAIRNSLEPTVIKSKKVKRKRKPMTEEQRAAAAERLAVARAKRQVTNTTVHPDVQALPDDNPLSMVNAKRYLKAAREKLSSIRSQKDAKESSARMEYQITENYVKNLQIYLRDGVYLDHRYGEKREGSVVSVCVTPSYDKDGNILRSHGVYYSDIDKVWGVD